jgi:peptidoglycan biosynthesis protein MviN/MurJ (putative lipid II flippase)
MRGAFLLTVLNPLLSIALVRELGAGGAALGTSIALISSAAYVVWTFHRVYVGSSVFALLRDVHLRPWLAAGFGVVLVLAVHSAFDFAPDADSDRIQAAVKVGTDALLFGGVYLRSLVVLGHITTLDRQNLARLAVFGYRSLRRPFTDVGDPVGG